MKKEKVIRIKKISKNIMDSYINHLIEKENEHGIRNGEIEFEDEGYFRINTQRGERRRCEF
ncbi:hypothetical protein GCM10010969_22750 [Saccharibacillus kuerlensis]|uniref:Uncharacterized protein n=1 Tax=Saccharibacillus kuerlensis TaxID=459527 RepID=A0ABQ2L346_9BACL|nr:hypothetical protein GCM10010969_22750 [Saccharibacillus kuerlensis]